MRSPSFEPPPYRYIAFIDEAGDPGIKRVRPIDPVGGTEWMTVGCALFQRDRERQLPSFVGEILARIHIRNRPDLHFRDLSPSRQKEVCELVARLPAQYFVVCSNKRNMRQYENPRAAAKMHGKQWFYNWLVRVLMERVTPFVYQHSLETYGEPSFVKFMFSRRGGHSYSQTKAYHEILRRQAMAKSAVLKYRLPEWRVMHRDLIEVVRHEDNAGLQIADCVASSFYTACDDLDTGPRYLEPAKLLKPKIALENGSSADFGVVLQPNPRFETTLLPEQKEIFQFFGYKFR
jgi:hypothetical protein